MRVRVRDDLGLAVLRDASTELGVPGARFANEREMLRAMAQAGQVFFIDTEDACDTLVEVALEGPLPEVVAEVYGPVGGSFLLHAPTGRLVLSGYGAERAEVALDVSAGSYAVRVFSLDPLDGNKGAKYGKWLSRQVGEADESFARRVDWLAPLGCLPALAAVIALLWNPSAGRVTLLLGIAVVSLLPHILLRMSARYRAVTARRNAVERELPRYYLELRPLGDAAGLVGGFVQ